MRESWRCPADWLHVVGDLEHVEGMECSTFDIKKPSIETKEDEMEGSIAHEHVLRTR